MLAALFVMTSGALAVTPIGDFAPLQVNNTWKYKGYQFNDYGSGASSKDSVLRTIVVKTKSVSTNPSSYLLTIRDSLFSRTLIQKSGSTFDTTHPASQILTDSGTVSETLSGVLSSSTLILQTFFRQHTVPDTNIAGKISVSSQFYWVYNSGAATYAQNFGMIDWNLLPQESYHLISFNGTVLGNYTVVGILPKSKPGHTMFSHMSGNIETILGTDLNLLGRSSILKNFPIKK